MTLALAGIVFAAFAIEAAAGFGATIVTVTLAAQFLPVERVLAALVPVNLALSSYIVARHWRAVDRRLLVRRILPWMGAGVAVGLALFQLRHLGFLRLAFAAFVVALAAVELWRARHAAAARPLSGAGWAATLLGAGVIHGLFACGGPLAVYAIGRELEDKSRFRATLSALWLVFNAVLIVGYLAGGVVAPSTMRDSAILVPSLVLGIVIGELVHRHVSEARFRVAVHVLLLAAGIALLARSL